MTLLKCPVLQVEWKSVLCGKLSTSFVISPLELYVKNYLSSFSMLVLSAHLQTALQPTSAPTTPFMLFSMLPAFSRAGFCS